MTQYIYVPSVEEKRGKLSPYLEKGVLRTVLEGTILPAATGAAGAAVQVVPVAINSMPENLRAGFALKARPWQVFPRLPFKEAFFRTTLLWK